MGKSLGVREIVLIFALGIVAFLIAAAQGPISFAESSVELGITSASPTGSAGGVVVPASCPSYAHIAGECTPTFTISGGGQTGGTGQSGTTINVVTGTQITLTWSCVNSASSSGNNFSTNGAPSGNVSVTPATNTTYTLVCSNGGQATTNVVVSSAQLSISASPGLVRSGQSSVISWIAVDVTSCTVSGPGVSASGLSNTATTPALTTQSTYTLSCVVPGIGTVSRSVTVGIIPRFEEE